MKANHKTLGVTILGTLIVIAIINNIGALEPVKDQLNGRRGWF
ncbi:hypothetical protein [Vibrio campbellii]|nr:hypothetical protein [Vibrio campbellii]